MINPRLTEFHGIYKPQIEVDFAIPFLDQDIPLYVDPFLLWKSPSYQDKAVHTTILNSFNNVGFLAKKDRKTEAVEQLVVASECFETGLGQSATRTGRRISSTVAIDIISLFARVDIYDSRGFSHFEEIQFFVDGISKDRISDIASSFMKSFLIDFTMDQCETHGIPMEKCTMDSLYNLEKYSFERNVSQVLPVHPQSKAPILLVPKRWLRFGPWLNFDDYFNDYCPRDRIFGKDEPPTRVKVLNFNRNNYDIVESYVKEKERTFADCKNDPLFCQIPALHAKRQLSQMRKLPSGKDGNADKKYEEIIASLMSSMLYPHLDFAKDQSRTDSGVLIRDLIFYNNRSQEFLKEIFDDFGSKQIVLEIKNVREVARDHLNQLNRYMADDLGRFGILVTRNALSASRFQSTIDLWSGQRRCLVVLTDADVEQMVELFESGQRLPLDVVKKKFVEFRRACPS